MKQAKITCPHCGGPITVRDNEGIEPAQAAKIWQAADEMFKAMDAHFRKVFDPKLWRR